MDSIPPTTTECLTSELRKYYHDYENFIKRLHLNLKIEWNDYLHVYEVEVTTRVPIKSICLAVKKVVAAKLGIAPDQVTMDIVYNGTTTKEVEIPLQNTWYDFGIDPKETSHISATCYLSS
ncbi:hypothetical protein COEREDRAFT_89015 [Coemansia reversa NRRL 1564]|uniref:Uncharacterized protein n=1 Tax=Coemansia reversa (strain ATCC 12441 / NRRL 1564) TaxID=763665 RepID=A0A2G5B4S7_COERN|nr:hypothetical protein COEREDRAFT_89015 [Coemansia reversa NRRL 1564]|eukprot:PIA14053.1 hypothetical protein COEREDRAFT_89015 [Coemansia reversa NRRL 1564]